MAEDSQSFPLYTAHQKSNEQQLQKLPIYNTPIKQTPNKFFIYAFSAFVFLSVAALIFSLIVLRVNSPTMNLSSISLAKFSVINSSSPPSLHLTFISQFSLHNSNFGPFNFDNGTVGFLHAGAIVGESTTGGGRAEAKGTETMNVTVEANLAENVSFANSSHMGVLNLISFANLRGRVRLIHILKKSTSSGITCSVNLDLNTHQIRPDWLCES